MTRALTAVFLATLVAASLPAMSRPASAAAPSAGAAPAVMSASAISGLRVAGTRLVDAAGRTVTLRGVNRMGTEYMCAQDRGIVDGPVDAAAIAAIRSWRTNALRIPLNEHCWLGVDDGAPTPQYLGEAYRQAIQALVQLSIASGLYPILELHWSAPAGQAAIGQRPMPNTTYSVDFWTSVAERFKGDTRVLFDLYNEPVPNNNTSDGDEDAARRSWECWRDGGVASCDAVLDLGTESTRMSAGEAVGMRALLDAVRATGATNVIMLGGIQWANTLWSSAAHNWLAYRPNDPLGNTVAAVHLYPDAWCVTIACYDIEVAPIAVAVPVVAAEFGHPSCDDAASAWIGALLGWLDARAIGYLAWAWMTPHDAADACAGRKLVAAFDGTPTPYGEIYRAHLAGLSIDTTTSIAASAAPSREGQTIAFTAQVAAASGPAAPSGGVVFVLDGTEVGTAALDAAARASFALTFADDGSHAVSARYVGAAGFLPSASAALTHVVENVAPVVQPVGVTSEPFSIGTPFTVQAAFTDAGTADTHVASVDWGDGTRSPASVVEANGTGTLNAGHAYAAAGIFAIVGTVTDDDGASTSSALGSVIVFDRAAGFVGGFGLFDSPPGAFTADALAEGRATVAFAAWYPAGASSPSGRLSVALRSAGFTFESTSYDWLVIVGTKARLEGAGRVNGADGYAFRVTALDGQDTGGDRLRIRIWNATTNAVVYDSQPGAPEDFDPTAAVTGAVVIRARGGP